MFEGKFNLMKHNILRDEDSSFRIQTLKPFVCGIDSKVNTLVAFELKIMLVVCPHAWVISTSKHSKLGIIRLLVMHNFKGDEKRGRALVGNMLIKYTAVVKL